MTVRFWGVRGSTPAPGPDTSRYGGHTTCVSVAVDDRLVVLDAGTGIRPLGDRLADTSTPVTLLFTHRHIDHISGFPFFAPLFEEDRPLELIGYPDDARGAADGSSAGSGPGGATSGDYWWPLSLLDGIYFPVQACDLPSAPERVEQPPARALAPYGLEVDALEANHPGGAFGYRLDHGGASFVFIPDNELHAPDATTSVERVASFCEGADVLCHDAQYLRSERADHRGWGHSTVNAACDLAVRAGVDHLVLFHHDPERSDDALDRIQRQARRRLRDEPVRCTAAYEGLELDL
jgi:phosphoribosyl 1,2-cyclic phosphodiesterase